MTVLQISSASPPFDRPALGMRGARLLGLAEAMGLLPGEQPIVRLDLETLMGPVQQLLKRGIGRNAALELMPTPSEVAGGAPRSSTDDPDHLAVLLDRLYQELLDSPSPQTEVHTLIDVLGGEATAGLAAVSASSLRRYAAGEREVPDAVAARLHHLAVILSHLAGGYNDFGIRRWFGRARAQLEGRSPESFLKGEWDPESPDAQRVLALAAALNSSPAT